MANVRPSMGTLGIELHEMSYRGSLLIWLNNYTGLFIGNAVLLAIIVSFLLLFPSRN